MFFRTETVGKHYLSSMWLLAADHRQSFLLSDHPHACVPWGLIEIRQRFIICSVWGEAWRSDWLLIPGRVGSACLVGICLAICVYFEERRHTGGHPSQHREGLLWKSGKNGFMEEKIAPGTGIFWTSGQKEGTLSSLLVTTWPGRHDSGSKQHLLIRDLKWFCTVNLSLHVRWPGGRVEIFSSFPSSATLRYLPKSKCNWCTQAYFVNWQLCVTLGKFLNLSDPQFLIPKLRNILDFVARTKWNVYKVEDGVLYKLFIT